MISAASTRIVNDLSQYQLEPVSAYSTIKPLTIVVEKTLVHFTRLKSFNKTQYKVCSYSIPDLLEEGSEPIGEIKEDVKTVEYMIGNDSTESVGGKMSFRILKYFTNWNASATGDLSIKIKTSSFKLRTIDDSVFDKAVKKRTFDMQHKLISPYINKPNHRLCIVTQVLETDEPTEIEFSSSHVSQAGLTVEMTEQGGSVNADKKSSDNKSLTLAKGTVLAYGWQPLDFNETTGELSINVEDSGQFLDVLKYKLQRAGAPCPGEEDDDVDWRLPALGKAKEEDIKKLKTAVFTILESSSDKEALLDLCAKNSVERCQFLDQLQNRDALLSLLELIGFDDEGDDIVLNSTGPFCNLIPEMLEAMSLFDSEDLALIGKCDPKQKKEILRIITAALDEMETIPISAEFKQELIQKNPLESVIGNVLAAMDFEIDFVKGKVALLSHERCALEAMYIILNCL